MLTMLTSAYQVLESRFCFANADSGIDKEAILMSTHNICFYGEISKIIPKLTLNTLCSTDRPV